MSDLDEIAFSEVVTCINCNEAIHKPYNSCFKDHLYCNRCTQKRPECSICHNLIVGASLTVYMTTKNDVPCRKREYGCKFMGNIRTTGDHEKICKYDSYPCPLPDNQLVCDWIGHHPKLMNHLEKCHAKFLRWNQPQDAFKPKRETLSKFRDCCTYPHRIHWGNPLGYLKVVFSAHEELFLLKFEAWFTGELKVCVEHLALKHEQDEKQFKYQITFGKLKRFRHNCGKTIRVLNKDLEELCEKNGDLTFEVVIFDKETNLSHRDGFSAV